MKYVISLLLGFVAGVAVALAGFVYNPLASEQSLSPLTVTDAQTVTLQYSGVSADSLMLTNDGLSRTQPHPEDVLQLWERPIRQTEAFATVLRDARNQTAGVGVKISSLSEKTRLINGEALVDSVWYVYLPGRGSLFIEQSENYWHYMRDIVLPAYRSSSDTWKGNWLGNMTAGPGALSTSKVTGGSGEFANTDAIGVEMLDVRAWSVTSGPVSQEGRLVIELPEIAPEDPDAVVADETG